MVRRATVLALGLLLSSGGVAQANPIASQILRARQVPETRHVQLTYGHDSSAGGTLDTPTAVARDGASVDVTWVTLSGGYTANTGSGLTSVDATQACDCDVPVGVHDYLVTVSAMSGQIPVNVTVVAGLAAAPRRDLDATDGDDADVFPWDIPEPTGIQGLDCVTVCGGGTAEPVVEPLEDAGPTADTADTADGGGVAGTVETDAGGGGGCSTSQGGLALLLTLLSLGLLAVTWRRTRA
ncbi:MAG: hypothetical protein CVU56_26630 [Deltaproteobacteria bacterium HGW-Deltaproteobacteria-14]|jgi:hypothetical protein|nr:MAG: hypothetical protein CVU56_26630 [Deltaproteobacteria bacterium HGW-Deltaproteobacteria-14]